MPPVTNNCQDVTISAAEYQRLKSLDPSNNNEKNQIQLQLQAFESMDSSNLNSSISNSHLNKLTQNINAFNNPTLANNIQKKYPRIESLKNDKVLKDSSIIQNYFLQQAKLMSNNNNTPLFISQINKDAQRFEMLQPSLNHSANTLSVENLPIRVNDVVSSVGGSGDNVGINFTSSFNNLSNTFSNSFNDMNGVIGNIGLPQINIDSMQSARQRQMLHMEMTIRNELDNVSTLSIFDQNNTMECSALEVCFNIFLNLKIDKKNIV